MQLCFGNQANRLKSVLTILLFIGFATGYSQTGCAGSDGDITICDYANPATQTIDLFTLLGDSPTPGGTWSDAFQTGALDSQTGILDVWDIHMSGIYVFTYTVTTGGCNDTSTVTLTLGGYSGISNADNSACNNDNSVNLFQFFVGDAPNPHQNGTWSYAGTIPNVLAGSILNAVAAGIGTHNFTYTVPAVGSCPAVSSSIAVTVYRSPIPGTRDDLLFCNTDDFSGATNINLFDHLSGEDANGQWTENLTNELSSPFDPFIDVQNIFNTYGMGTYSFSYTVYPPHPVCSPRTTVVRLFIEEFLDFTGATLTVNSDICDDEIPDAVYTAVITPAIQPMEAVVYNISYEITGPQNTLFSQNSLYSPTTGFSFSINPAFFPVVGDYTVTITNIKKNSDHGACDNIVDLSDVLHVYPIPVIDAGTVSFSPICQAVDGEVEISGNTNLGTGSYQISYDLAGANTVTNQMVTINSVNGIATFTIPAALLPNPGSTTISIFLIVNLTTGCDNTAGLVRNFIVNGNTISNLSISANDSCSESAVMVDVTGLGPMTAVIVTYGLSGANTANNQTIIAPVTSGNASFAIPIALTPNSGATTFTITQISDNVTLCSTTVNVNGVSFTIHPLPPTPVAPDAVFCSVDNATVADLVPGGSQYLWYDSATATTPLDLSELLVSGLYFVAEGSSATSCESERTEITVTVITLEQLVLNPGGQEFCGADNPTLQDLSDNVLADNVIVWYDAAVNGNPLPISTLLVEDMTYYGADSFPGSSCNSPLLAIKVSLDECPDPDYGLFIPDGFSPNGDSVNDVFRIPDVQHLFPDYVLEIYNRYGNLMFKGNASNPAWDGRNSQSDNLLDGIAANGVYFYVLYYNKNNAPPRQGQLYLNR